MRIKAVNYRVDNRDVGTYLRTYGKNKANKLTSAIIND